MGLLDFTKNIGKKLFGSEDEAPKKINDLITNNNPGVQNLDVSVENGTATLSGQATDAEAKEKAILMTGNIEGIEKVQDHMDAPDGGAAASFYIVESGDNLWKIAEKTLGDGSKNHLLFEANKEIIVDPDKIFPGQKLRIPTQH